MDYVAFGCMMLFIIVSGALFWKAMDYDSVVQSCNTLLTKQAEHYEKCVCPVEKNLSDRMNYSLRRDVQ